MRELTSDQDIETVVRTARTVAVLGAHPDQARPAHFVPAYLARNGFEVIPVNSAYEGAELFGRGVLADLRDVDRPVDVVDVFRRAEALPQHVDEILSMSPLPKVVWFQKGIRNDEVASRLIAAGIEVVQDRCLKMEHGRTRVADRSD